MVGFAVSARGFLEVFGELAGGKLRAISVLKCPGRVVRCRRSRDSLEIEEVSSDRRH